MTPCSRSGRCQGGPAGLEGELAPAAAQLVQARLLPPAYRRVDPAAVDRDAAVLEAEARQRRPVGGRDGDADRGQLGRDVTYPLRCDSTSGKNEFDVAVRPVNVNPECSLRLRKVARVW